MTVERAGCGLLQISYSRLELLSFPSYPAFYPYIFKVVKETHSPKLGSFTTFHKSGNRLFAYKKNVKRIVSETLILVKYTGGQKKITGKKRLHEKVIKNKNILDL